MLKKYLQPENAPVTQDRPEIGFDFDTTSDRGMVRPYQLKTGVIGEDQIDDGAITNSKLASTAISSGKIQNGAVTNAKIASFDWSKGTGGTIGTAMIVGGTVGTAVIGTSIWTAGTVNADMYMVHNALGLSTSIGYLSAGTVAGTLQFSQGLLIAVT